MLRTRSVLPTDARMSLDSFFLGSNINSEQFLLGHESDLSLYGQRLFSRRTLTWISKRIKLWYTSLSRSDVVVLSVSLGLFLWMSIHFYVPSSLYIYVVGVCFTSPAWFLTEVWGHVRHRKPVRWMLTAFTGILTAFSLVCLLLDTFSHPAVPAHWRQPQDRTYYIASLLHNSEAILPHYARSLLSLVHDLGPSNVYISIYENDSTDRTPSMLQKLDQQLDQLGVQRTIVTTTQPSEVQKWDRIARLSMYRNLAMAPFNDQMHGALGGRPFDKVIWINDVLFEADTVHALLDTQGGEFDQACAMDFCWLGFYDTWVMRDADGRTTRPFWPYFKAPEDQRAVQAGLPVPVNACWNGITAFDARWFRNTTIPTNAPISPLLTAARTLPSPPLQSKDVLDVAATVPLTFRESPICYASESLLSSLDMHRIAKPYRPRIYVNPTLTVAYDGPNYFLYGRMMHWSVTGPWRYFWQYWIEHKIFGFALHILGRVDPCTDVFMPGWVPRRPV